jgi:hypothetical protein
MRKIIGSVVFVTALVAAGAVAAQGMLVEAAANKSSRNIRPPVATS